MKETFKDIPGYEGLYQVSNKGSVRSLDRTSSYGRKLKGKTLRGGINSKGYKVVGLCKEGKQSTLTLHSLVAEVFIGPRPEGLVCDHIDEVKTNNDISNLRYITKRENISRSIRGGTSSYTGVSWNKQIKMWVAQITVEGKKKNLGYYEDEVQASEAYQNYLKII